MNLTVHTTIHATQDQIWKLITDIENAVNYISNIEKIEVLHKPSNGIVGLKWRETRTLFGKTATEVMWITSATPNQEYTTRAESHGAIYTTILTISQEGPNQCRLSMTFGGKPQNLFVKILSFLTTPLVKSATRKALAQDLADIKTAAEKH